MQFLKNHRGGRGSQIDPLPPASPAVLGLIKCEINLILTCSESCVISSATRKTKSAITDTKLYAPVVTLSNQDNAKLLEKLRFGFKRIINWNNYQ